MGNNSCFSKVLADIFPSWYCVKTHLNTAVLQSPKTSAFPEVLTLADHQLMRYT